jgi:hypothetical protein
MSKLPRPSSNWPTRLWFRRALPFQVAVDASIDARITNSPRPGYLDGQQTMLDRSPRNPSLKRNFAT